jgi:SAM-dependent methyltransferase
MEPKVDTPMPSVAPLAPVAMPARQAEGTVDAAVFKDGWRWLWEQGDYRPVGERTVPAAEELVAATGIQSFHRVLEVGAGVGNAARIAARLGAVVTASDFAPSMVEAGRALSAAEGLAVEWLEADIEDLPLPDASFDVVLSTFGIECAPRVGVAVGELHRVLRPGGTLGLTQWTPTDFMGQMEELFLRYQPIPEDHHDPLDWGVEQTVRDRLGEQFGDVRIERSSLVWRFPSAAAVRAFWETKFPPTVFCYQMLGAEAAASLRADFDALTARYADADGAIALPFGYLVIVATAR